VVSGTAFFITDEGHLLTNAHVVRDCQSINVMHAAGEALPARLVALVNNPILLHQFPSVRLLAKPAILTFFSADFLILTPQKEPILIEIEKADTRLLRKNGDEAWGLTHAFDQVRNWLHVVAEHRLAVLASLDILPDQVGNARGVVIAGRDQQQHAEHLRRLKAGSRERIAFMTFDDLVSSLASLADKVGRV
jgi:hypothetical protein